jgi:hypothetical protein
MSAVCSTLQIARSNIAEQVAGRPAKRRGRPPQPDEDLVAAIKAIIGSLLSVSQKSRVSPMWDNMIAYFGRGYSPCLLTQVAYQIDLTSFLPAGVVAALPTPLPLGVVFPALGSSPFS